MSNVSSDKAEPVSPKNKSWNPWLGITYVVVIFFVSQVFAAILLNIYVSLKGWSAAQANDWLQNSLASHFAYILLSSIFIVGAILAFVRPYTDGFRSIGLRRPKWTDPLFGLAALPLYMVLYVIIVSVVSHLVPGLDVGQEQQLGFNDTYHGVQLLIVFISLVVLPPITEEIMFRGFLYTTFRKLASIPVAAVLTSGLFAAAHLPEGGSAGPLYIAALDTFILSLVLIYLREKTGSLWASITLHAIKNGIAFFALFVFSVK